MSIKTRLIKLEKERGGRGKIYAFRMSDGMDMKAIQEEFCNERGIEPNVNDMFYFGRIFSYELSYQARQRRMRNPSGAGITIGVCSPRFSNCLRGICP